MYKKPRWILLIGALPLAIGLFFGIRMRDWIYPPLHRTLSSPEAYVKKHGEITKDAASVSNAVIEHGSRDKPLVALTFDADMTPAMLAMLKSGIAKSWYNRDVKRVLDDQKAKATIFMGGLWAEAYPRESKELGDDPLIELGNHSFNHYAFANGCFSLPFISDSQDGDDVMRAQEVIRKTTGITPKYFRFPGGCYESVDVKTIGELGLQIVHWDVISHDGFNLDTDSIVRSTVSEATNGSIIVMHIHDGSYAPKTAEALRKIIPELRTKGFEFVKISELIAADY